MFLYAGGCSMTFGSELVLDDDNEVRADPVLNQRRIELAWPHLLAQKLEFDGHHNAGVGGCSNDMILRDMMTWVSKDWLAKDRSPDDLFVILNWTSITRWEFFFKGRYETVFGDSPPFENRDQRFRRFWSRFLDYGCGDPWMSWRHFVMQTVQAAAFLKANGIRYGMSYGVISPRASVTGWIKSQRGAEGLAEFALFSTLLDDSRFLGFHDSDSGMCQFLYKNGIDGDKLAPRGHPLEEGHEAWAAHVAEWINTNGLLEPV